MIVPLRISLAIEQRFGGTGFQPVLAQAKRYPRMKNVEQPPSAVPLKSRRGRLLHILRSFSR
jgi:hypothetical protein